jgi:2-polyprenyl-6-methoxyphenol hydroxylase-like FAD-dependent oxidoreductase
MDELAFRERLAVNHQAAGSDNPSGIQNCNPSSQEVSLRCHRGRLETLLGEGQSIIRGKRLRHVRISAQPPKIITEFKDGTSLESECVVGCDGPHSITRRSLANEMKLKVLPYVVFNGKRRISVPEYVNNMHPYMQDSVLRQMQIGDTLLEISINDYTASQTDMSYTYSRPARGDSDPLYKSNRAISGQTDIPGEFHDELKALRVLRPPFAYVFDAEKVREDRVLHWLMRSLTPSTNQLGQLAEQRVILIGDAVHPTPILGGEGANVAIRDGIDLAENIAAHGVNDLKSFVSQRCEMWKTAVEESEKRIQEMHAL